MGKQNVSVELYYSSTWNSVPVYVRNPITIVRGQGDESAAPSASQLSCTLNDRAQMYNPRNAMSPLYGLIGRNTPVRVGFDLAVESFGGTSSSGWTPTDDGQAWTGVGAAAADFTESAGIGRHLQPLKNIIRLSVLPEARRNVEQVTTVAIPAVATGASAVAGHVARYVDASNYYWLRMEFDVGGALTAKISKRVGGTMTELAAKSGIPGLTYTGGQGWQMRSSVQGSRLAIRIWRSGTEEPAGWTLTAYDSSFTAAGKYGLASWVVSGNTNTTELRFDDYRAVDRRAVLEVSSWKPGQTADFDPTTDKGDAWVEIEAAGILRRLNQGTQPTKSALRRTIDASGPVAYWPLEDGTDAGQGGSAVSGVPALTITGTAPFDDIDTWMDRQFTVSYGTAALVDVSQGAILAASLPATVTTATGTAWTVHVACDFPGSAELLTDFVLLEVDTPGGTYVRWRVLLVQSTYDVQVVAYNSAGAATVVCTDTAPTTTMWSHTLVVWQNGGNISAGLMWDSGSGYDATGSVAGTLAGVTAIRINPTAAVPAANPLPVGHLALWAGQALATIDHNDGPVISSLLANVWTNVSTGAAAVTGEPATQRLARIATEEGLTVGMPAVDPATERMMGRQPIATLAGLLGQSADVDGGLLFEPRDSLALDYRPLGSLYNQSAALTIDWAARQVATPFSPVVDDLAVRNDITVTRTDGASARAVQTDGRLAAVPPPAGVGVYEGPVELNLVDDSRLADIAGWLLHEGTVDETRLPQVTVDLVASPELTVAAAAVDTGDRIAVTGLPAGMGGSRNGLLVLGSTEVIGSHTRTITFNCMPGSVYDVAVADGEQRAPADATTLVSGITATDTAIPLTSTTASGRWTTDPADFPLDAMVGGELVRLASITGAGLSQTANVAPGGRALNGVARSWSAGTPVDAAAPAVSPL